MKVRKSGSRVLWYEGLGFVLIIALSWLNELADLSHHLLGGGGHVPDLRDCVLETVGILLIWLLVYRLTRRLLGRVYYLEGFLRVCAWCRKVCLHDRWIPVEQYFAEGFHIETTHGMCPECRKKVEEDTTRFIRKELLKKKPPAGNAADTQIAA